MKEKTIFAIKKRNFSILTVEIFFFKQKFTLGRKKKIGTKLIKTSKFPNVSIIFFKSKTLKKRQN